ncbi:UNVERIFIED_CONTAM: hypothetical protein FKN15_055526 [Acipenser sinensis]
MVQIHINFALSNPKLLSESQINMVKVVNSVSDALNSMQKEQGGIKTRLKADLQKAPARGARPRGCANGSRPRDCSDIYTSGQREDGIYSVFPTHYPSGFQVFCDMSTDGGGWTAPGPETALTFTRADRGKMASTLCFQLIILQGSRSFVT